MRYSAGLHAFSSSGESQWKKLCDSLVANPEGTADILGCHQWFHTDDMMTTQISLTSASYWLKEIFNQSKAPPRFG